MSETLIDMCGGAVYPTVFTFKERAAAVADVLQKRLVRASIDSAWPARAFRVAVTEAPQIVITHRDRPSWQATISPRDVFFRDRRPDVENVRGFSLVCGRIIEDALELLRMDGPSTVGAKFSLLTDEAHFDAILARCAGSALRTQGDEGKGKQLRYRIGAWEAAIDLMDIVDGQLAGAHVLALDFFCRESDLVPGDYTSFFNIAWDHLRRDVIRFVVHQKV